jgi:hypothetical protein
MPTASALSIAVVQKQIAEAPHREANCRIVLADHKISVEADDSHRLLHEFSYNQVQSISYSRGFDPLEAPRAVRGGWSVPLAER